MEGKSFGSDELWKGKSHKVPLMKTNGQNQDHRQHAGGVERVSPVIIIIRCSSPLLYKFATVLSVSSDGRMELEQDEGEQCGQHHEFSTSSDRDNTALSSWLLCTAEAKRTI